MIRFAAFASWIILTVLSLVPGQDRPHTGASGNVEHFVAYMLSAGATRLGFDRPRDRWQLLAFSGASAVFEICQIWIPGRSAGADNWAASTAGALFGIISAKVAISRHRRRGRSL